MIRKEIKEGIRDSLLPVPGLNSVYTARQKQMVNKEMPSVTVYLPQVTDKPITTGMPRGKRHIKFTALLEVIAIDADNAPEEGEARFDNLLDAIDAQLRTELTFGGVALGSGIRGIETKTAPPQLVEGQNILRTAIKQFEVLVETTGVGEDGEKIYMLV